MTTHAVIPDLQVKPGDPLDHLTWISKYLLERRPDVIVNLGDTYDMESLCSFDRGKIQFEGRRYKEDIEAGNNAFRLLDASTDLFNKGRRKRRQEEYKPRKIFLLGNHEQRIERCIQDNPILDGTIGYQDLNTRGWEVFDYLEPVDVDGVIYAHFFPNPMTGKPLGGVVSTRLKTIGHSFSMGHQQILDYSMRYVRGQSQHGLVAGAAYLASEGYKGYIGNQHWRGIIIKNHVENGSYDLSLVSLDSLCRKYEGVPVGDFMEEKYPEVQPWWPTK